MIISENYNMQLKALYLEKAPSLDTMFKTLKYENYSSPLLIHAFEDYNQAPVKLMIFGQETNGWGSRDNKPSHCDVAEVERILKIYENFKNGVRDGRNCYTSPFWSWSYKFARMLYEKTNIKQNEGFKEKQSFIWNNILKLGKFNTKGKPSSAVIEYEMKEFNVVFRELEILQPKVCIFFTGPSYDKYIKSKFKGISFDCIEGYKKRQLAKLRHDFLPTYSYRTYHPGYGNRVKDMYEDIFEKIIQDIEKQKTKNI